MNTNEHCEKTLVSELNLLTGDLERGTDGLETKLRSVLQAAGLGEIDFDATEPQAAE